MKNLAIGIDLGGTNLKGVVLERDGTRRYLERIPTEAGKGGTRVMENIVRLVQMLLEKVGSTDDIVGVGIGTPGFVNDDGLILGGAENIPGWKGTNMFDPIREQTGLETAATNDVTVTALAEARYGVARDVRNMACLALGTGIGGGVIIDGRVYTGTHGMAGELGHIPVETGGLPCTCGGRGCVEQYASATGIVKNALIMCLKVPVHSRTAFVDEALAAPNAVTSKMVYDYVAKGDPVAIEVHEFVCDKLACASGAILNAFAPDMLVLGGGVMMAGRIIVDTVVKYLPRYCWQQIFERCRVVSAELGQDAGVLGAAALAFDRLGGE
ncbi:MAG: ROK family protein [Chitinivibrionales bacterium]|nr:ROK family protein [Chitinivibrionales bacterium]